MRGSGNRQAMNSDFTKADEHRFKIQIFLSSDKVRPVVPRCAGCAMAHPDFGRSVNPISTKGDRLCPTIGFASSKIFRDYSPVQ